MLLVEGSFSTQQPLANWTLNVYFCLMNRGFQGVATWSVALSGWSHKKIKSYYNYIVLSQNVRSIFSLLYLLKKKTSIKCYMTWLITLLTTLGLLKVKGSWRTEVKEINFVLINWCGHQISFFHRKYFPCIWVSLIMSENKRFGICIKFLPHFRLCFYCLHPWHTQYFHYAYIRYDLLIAALVYL